MDTICPPLRWNMVEIGVSRGAYPLLRNFRHLSRMRLKTIVSLIPEPPSADIVEFSKMAGIELVYIQVINQLFADIDGRTRDRLCVIMSLNDLNPLRWILSLTKFFLRNATPMLSFKDE
jgi:Tyrosine phosphatase family